MSTTEAEYIALGHGVTKAVWMNRFVHQFELEATKINLNISNEMSITLTKNAES